LKTGVKTTIALILATIFLVSSITAVTASKTTVDKKWVEHRDGFELCGKCHQVKEQDGDSKDLVKIKGKYELVQIEGEGGWWITHKKDFEVCGDCHKTKIVDKKKYVKVK
jgi:cytochrome c553